MNKKIGISGLISICFLSISNFPASANIPQTSLQENWIEGEFNQVNQQIHQNLIFNFVYLPEIEASLIPTLNIRGTFLENQNNQVEQKINQTVLGLDLGETHPSSFGIDNLLNGNNLLEGIQFNTQEILIQGDDNSVTQHSTQFLTNFLFLEPITESQNFSQVLETILREQSLDSFQLNLQDTLIFGKNNFVSQEINQTLTSFIFLKNELNPFFNEQLTHQVLELEPTQLTIQETFIELGENNLITQNINQNISNISLLDARKYYQNKKTFLGNSSGAMSDNSLIDFDIDEFIDIILNQTIIEATQINRQSSVTIGKGNEINQENKQILIISIPEPNSPQILLLLAIIVISRRSQRLAQSLLARIFLSNQHKEWK